MSVFSMVSISAVMEIIIEGQLRIHVEQTGKLNMNQHGFRSQLSCTTVLLKKWKMICKSRKPGGKGLTGILVDLTSAFDMAGHDFILKRPTTLGCGDRSEDSCNHGSLGDI